MHNRRKFIRNISLTAGLFAAGKMLGGNNDNRVTGEIPAIILPPKLQKGDLVALMAPAGAIFNDDTVSKATAAVEAMGFRVKVGETAKTKTGYLAGDDEFRAKEFMSFINDKEVKAIIALRGGWGCARMLPFIDMTMIPDNPKIISGFSDITTLLLAFYAKLGLVTFHGPVGNSTWEGPQVQVIHAGYGKGILLGGNLSIICSLIGTGYLPDFAGSILFLEETEEEPYRVDRLLTQLEQNGILSKLAGVVFGTCAKCEPEEPEKSFTLDQVLDHHFKKRNYPVLKGFAIGHIKDKFTLPVGVMAELSTEKGTLTLLEPAVR
jgi:muramoyltetrapeptide carboxypeptidase